MTDDVMDIEAEFVETSSNPAPTGSKALWLPGTQGAKIRAGVFPAIGSPKGTFFVIPGKSEFIEKYFETASELGERGYASVVFDLRGQGLSQRDVDHPLKGHVNRFEDFVDDLESCYAQAVLKTMPGPHYVLGHSMGGAVALHWLARKPGLVGGVLSAPMAGFAPRPGTPPMNIVKPLMGFGVLIGAGKAWIPGTGNFDPFGSRFEDNSVTRDPERWEKIINIVRSRPEIAQGGPTMGWMREAIGAVERMEDPGFCASVDLPTLVFGAASDKLVCSDAVRQLAGRLPGAEFVEIEDAEHEILMERDHIRASFWSHFDRFLQGLGGD